VGFVETEGLVLRKYSLGDADRIVLVLTESHGLVRGVANGAKRLKSKFHSSLEFFSRIHINYFQKEERELVSIRSTDLVESVFSKISSPVFFDAFSEIADLLIRFTPSSEPNKRLYHMTRHCLAAAIEDEESIPAVRLYFEIWLLKLGGFLPSWEHCSKCGGSLTDSGGHTLDIDFQIECEKCSLKGEPIESGMIMIFNYAQKTAPQKFAIRISETGLDFAPLVSVVGRLSDTVLERAPLVRSGK
jgi:DNA repair protein RecO (recombination protein O)